MTTPRKTAAKKAVAPKPSLTGAEAGVEPTTRTVITSDGTQQLPEVSSAAPVVVETPVADNVVSSEATGRFKDLEVEELQSIAEFFVKDFDPAAGKTEMLAALASSDEDEQAVTWEDYENLYLPAQPPKSANVPERPAGNPLGNDEVIVSIVPDTVEEEQVLVKMERKNPRYDVAGYTFTQEHPFNSVPEKTAEFIARQPGFRLALPSEVRDYYN